MRKAALVLHERGHREGAGAAARRIHRNEDVVDVVRRLADVVDDLVGDTLHHCLDVTLVERFLAAAPRRARLSTSITSITSNCVLNCQAHLPSAEMPKLSRKLVVVSFCVCGCGNVKEQCKEMPQLWT